jgi:bifunctional DNase/RNase
MDVEMKIRGLMLDPITNMPIVVLKDVNGDTVLPIWVGISEAHAIKLEIEKVALPRPMTHDLLKNALYGLNASVHKVVVTELRDDTFYAVIWMEQDGQLLSMDARPSDALALALRADCPVYVSEQVLRTTRVAAGGAEDLTTDELRRWLENLNDEDLGPYKM